jgi:hypothetical protein
MRLSQSNLTKEQLGTLSNVFQEIKLMDMVASLESGLNEPKLSLKRKDVHGKQS